METDDDPVTRWIEGLKAGDEDAIAGLWSRYFDRLVHLARKKLAHSPRRVADEEDVAVSVFRCLCAGVEQGRLREIADRDDLWRVLVTMTLRKAIDQQRRLAGKKRGSGKVRGESVFARRGPTNPHQACSSSGARSPLRKCSRSSKRRGNGCSTLWTTRHCAKSRSGSWRASPMMKSPRNST